MFGNLLNDVKRALGNWKPSTFPNEKGYQNDLATFLRGELNSGSPFAIGKPQRIAISREDGRKLCDIAIDKKIGIEIKKDLKKKSAIDRLIGQIDGYKEAYEDIIVVLVGHGYAEAIDELDRRLNKQNKNFSFALGNEPIVEVINKTENRKREESNPFGF